MYIHQSTYFQQASFVSNTSVIHCPNYTIHHHELSKHFSLYWILLFNTATVLLVIPLLDRVVYPLCFPWVPNMLTRIGIGICISLFSIICALSAEAIRYDRFMRAKSDSVVDLNVYHFSKLFAVDIPVGVMTPQFGIQAVAECLVFVTSK